MAGSQDNTEALLDEERIFRPLPEMVNEANLKVNEYNEAVRQASEDLEGYWEKAAEELEWFKKWNKVLDRSDAPFFKWFTDAKCNIAHNALDRHINTPLKNKVAIIWEGEDGTTKKITYYELYRESNRFANVLNSLGVKKGDRVTIYLPNIPEVAVAMLGCAKIGAIHNVVYAGFSASALRERVNDSESKVIITADGFSRRGKLVDLKSIVDQAYPKCPKIESIIIVRQSGHDIDMNNSRYMWFHELMEGSSTKFQTVHMDSEDPLFFLYTSGTTGKPKAIVHVHGGYMVGINRTLNWVFDLKPTDIYWCAADPGWITGHSYIIYGPLIAGTTTVMYEGHPAYPKADRMWQIIEKFGINILYTSPTTIRMLMRYGDDLPKKHDTSTLRLLGSVGEPINPEAWIWYYKHVGKENCPVMDTWWQTETGMFLITPLPISLLKPGSCGKAFPGIEADIIDKSGKSVPDGSGGFLAIKNPWPSMMRTLYKNAERYKADYWEKIPGYYVAGDVARKDKDGYFWVQGRADDVLNISGHRIGTAEIESALVSHKSVVEAAVIGIPDSVKGEVAKAFVILSADLEGSEELGEELISHIRHELGPIAVTKSIDFVESLPKTRSGKIMRRVLKARELGMEEGDLTTLAD